ncbi:hypothetical protein MNEG_9755 [Monoraphidium neglectum]|uniref:Uncharacterized protein n=1 Tax=Monoraphidium neglectum TaxID=145388 RepID=A0A0D2M3S5_9CHLO|nr:hypothetical protein MNEG_9755 [Monoraphidium neglectum]KIY98209.1 hypothetical protein MNEG_9755 [Monoraphidium neglectum]|eukprot:XP_013897229.1 hypothetical protein MNEG_9755 [Monoraphidium neglectum]
MALSSAAPDASDTAAQDASVFDAVRVPPLEGRQALASPIKHVTIEQRAPLSQILAETLQLPQQLFVELMRFGAVHYAPVMPKPVKRKNTNLEHLREIRAARRAGMQVLASRRTMRDPTTCAADARAAQPHTIRKSMEADATSGAPA